jgi:xanthine dehydrogenase molybdopterin-binding subunit B
MELRLDSSRSISANCGSGRSKFGFVEGGGWLSVARADQAGALRTDVADLEHAAAAQRPLDIEVPLLHIRRAQVALEGQGGGRVGIRKVTRERVGEQQRLPWR